MAVFHLYFFIWYFLSISPWCYAAGSTSSEVLGPKNSEPLHPEDTRVVYLTFHQHPTRALLNPQTGLLVHRIAASIELSHYHTLQDSTTQLYIGCILSNGQKIFIPTMAEGEAVWHHAHAEIGQLYVHSLTQTTIRFRLGTTRKRNSDIINPYSGAGLWVDSLTSDRQISPRNTFVNIWKRLIQMLMPDPIQDNTYLHTGNRLHLQAIENYWNEMAAYQTLQRDFSNFPVPIIIHQKTGPPHPVHWLEDDVMYNVLNVRRPHMIEASPNHANAWDIVNNLHEVEYVRTHNRVNRPGEESVTGPHGPAHGP